MVGAGDVHVRPEIDAQVEIEQQWLRVHAVVVPVHKPRSHKILGALGDGRDPVAVASPAGKASQAQPSSCHAVRHVCPGDVMVFSGVDESGVRNVGYVGLRVDVGGARGYTVVDAYETWKARLDYYGKMIQDEFVNLSLISRNLMER